MMKVTARSIAVGSRSWEVIDRRGSDEVDFEQDKAIRVLSACRPIFLDGSLFALRAQIPEVIFVFERA